ncbi:porin [Serratia sp. M24T3]|uniref:porin n=1 Tax=Serratia sp. M24T3 TaxID=932213 RepID=UPI00025B9F46|nr:porin [Serratia sp. M24T3]EIC84138.1 outer membrane protein [Serratia sp. M24T3]
MRNLKRPVILGGVILSVISASAHAEITVLDKNTTSNSLLAPLSIQIGGSIRPEFEWENTENKTHGASSGHDGGTRFRFSGDYALDSHTSIIGMYELGVNMYHVLGIDSGYTKGTDELKKRKLYYGFKDDRYGTFTFGKQYGVYYDIVGSKSDVWDNDGQAAGEGVGLAGDFDGGNRPYDTFKYKNTWGKFTVEAHYMLPYTQTAATSDLDYRRRGGQGIGVDYAITPTLTWSGVYTNTQATVKQSQNASESKLYHQQTTATALTWQPGSWYLVGTANYYANYIPSHKDNVNQSDFFAGSGYGLEAFAGYTFTFNKPWFKSIQPYVAADTLKLKGGEDYESNHIYLGTAFDFNHRISLYVERTIATSPGEDDKTYASFYYNF